MSDTSFRWTWPLLYLLAAPLLADAAVAADEKHRFVASRAAGTVDRVEFALDVGGELTAVLAGAEPRKEKMSVRCTLRYDELTLDFVPSGEGGIHTVRYYEEAAATIVHSDRSFTPVVRPGRMLIVSLIEPPEVSVLSPAGPLTRDELDVMDLIGNSAVLDLLLPTEPVSVGVSWALDEGVLAALLRMDEVQRSDVAVTLTEVADVVSRFEMAGSVTGLAEGVPSDIELKARFRFLRGRQRVDWLGMLVREHRTQGPASGEMDAVARVQITLTPGESPPELSEEILESLPLEPSPETLLLVCQPADGSWSFIHDRRWFHLDDQEEAAALRLVEGGELIAHCNVALLPPASPEKLPVLEQFQHDIRNALGERFGRFVEASQRAGGDDYRILRSVIAGTINETPNFWYYYLIADPQGRRVVFAFSVRADYVEPFAGEAEVLIESFRFAPAEG